MKSLGFETKNQMIYEMINKLECVSSTMERFPVEELTYHANSKDKSGDIDFEEFTEL
jgi:hypothetical protein